MSTKLTKITKITRSAQNLDLDCLRLAKVANKAALAIKLMSDLRLTLEDK